MPSMSALPSWGERILGESGAETGVLLELTLVVSTLVVSEATRGPVIPAGLVPANDYRLDRLFNTGHRVRRHLQY